MRIYYFGELIEVNGQKVATVAENEVKGKVEEKQMELKFSTIDKRSSGMQSIGEILQELDLTRDSFRPGRNVGGRGVMA